MISQEYKDLISKKLILEEKIKNLPVGYISKKKIGGKYQFYLQHREKNKIISSYIKNDEFDEISKGIVERKLCLEELSVIENRLRQLEQAARMVDRDLYCQLLLYKMSYKMDTIDFNKKQMCSSFASAMNAIEGVMISDETNNEIEKWKNGEKSFLSVFEDILHFYGFPVEVRK